MKLKYIFLISVLLHTFQSTIAQVDVGTTGAALEVSSTGALTYNIPIAIPPGVGNVAPGISLSYSSQSGNGIAGWGWNISGISTISRVGATLVNDGFVDGVDFEPDDRYVLDGQRLIVVSGQYGKPNSIYATENQSNIKIIAYGTNANGANSGPKYFKAFHPDGSIVTYKNITVGRVYNNEVTEWVIQQMEDPLGNRIQYHYHVTTHQELIRIKKIEYAGPVNSATGHPNTIEFFYATRKRPETSYVPGMLKSTRKNILKTIEVKTHGKLYRKYTLKHKVLKSSYELVDQVEESNGAGKKLSPITFNYPPESQHNLAASRKVFTVNQSFKAKKRVISGDFDGDSHLDFVVYDKDDRTYFSNHLKARGYDKSVRTDTPKRFESVRSATLLQGNNTVSKKQHLLTMLGIKGGKYFFRGYLSDNSGKFKSRYYRSYIDQKLISKPYVAKVLVVGNFLGNGLTTGLFMQRRSKHVVFADFNKETNSNTNIPFVQSGNLLTTYDSNTSFLKAADYDGDGKDELWHFQKNKLHIYTLNRQQKLELMVNFTNDEGRLTLDRQILMGDYNGDGKTDLLVPQINGTKWLYLFARGNNYSSSGPGSKLPFRKVFANFTNIKYVKDTNTKKWFYISQDFDGDGKSDLIRHQLDRKNHKIQLFINEQVDATKMNLVSTASGTLSISTTDSNFNAIPILLDVNLQNPNHEYVFAYDNKLEAFSLTKDHRKDVRVVKIKNNLLEHTIKYNELDSGNDTYTPRVGNKYPYIHINASPGLPLVKQLIEKGSGITRKRDFKYEGAITHALGHGFIGFRFLKSTDWYGENTPIIWNISDYSMNNKRGAIKKSWRSLDYSSDPANAMIQLEYSYLTKNTNGVFINKLTKVTTKDNLLGFTSSETISYDQYYNPTKVVVQNPTSTTTTTYKYSNNYAGNNHAYHIGRKLEESIQRKRGSNTKKHVTTYEYYGSGKYGKIKKVKKRHNNVTGVQEAFTYDNFGNLIKKTISASGVPDRTESYAYSSDGRFMISKTDLENQKTTYTYDSFTGNPTSSKDHLNKKMTTQYDGWGRTISETDYLGKKTIYSYSKVSHFTRHLAKMPDGSQSFKDIDAFGLERRMASRAYNGQWIWENTDFDASGRKFRESEPRYSSDPYQWNTFKYDAYGRQISSVAYTGLTVNSTYSGLTVTTFDGTKSVATTKDHEDNTISVTDPGGTIRYTYDADNNMVLSDYDGYKIQITYDAFGRKTKLVDPSAGIYNYKYNNYNQILEEKTPKGKTNYTYDQGGKVISKIVKGDLTDISENYTYNDQSRDVALVTGKSNGESYTYSYSYDRYFRLVTIKENNDKAAFEKKISYDNLGRVSKETFIAKASGKQSTIEQTSIYGNYGQLIELRSGASSLWKLEKQNAKEQVEKATLGNGFVQNTLYDANNFIKQARDERKVGNQTIFAMRNEYNFDAKTGRLQQRINHKHGGITERFTYDNLNRLTKVRGAVSHTMNYDLKGRITENSNIGSYHYASLNSFQLSNINLNAKGDNFYKTRPLHQMSFNAFKKPVTISQEGHGKITYAYNLGLERSHAYYGNEAAKIEDRKYHKHYSGIFSAEVIENKENNTIKFITYLGGDAYNASVIYLKRVKGQNTLEEGFKYIHRDYLGSILAISNSQGDLEESTHYGAWGTIDKHWSKVGNSSFNYESILQRGYTGHEHFFDVDLIHMNGRLYDANLGRFISPDNYVQDPGNTQNYNRYGYAYNNPLMFNDPSGEFFLAAVFAVASALGGTAIATVAAAFIVGGASAVLFNGVANLVNGESFFSGAGSAFLFGGISGVISFGIGQISWSNSVFQHAAHGLSGGFMSVLQGGDFGSGFASGFISHAIAAGTDMLVGENSAWRDVAIVASGTLAGGISSKLAGGSWVMGIRQGFVSSLLNQTLSQIEANRRSGIAAELGLNIPQEGKTALTAPNGQRVYPDLYEPTTGTIIDVKAGAYVYMNRQMRNYVSIVNRDGGRIIIIGGPHLRVSRTIRNNPHITVHRTMNILRYMPPRVVRSMNRVSRGLNQAVRKVPVIMYWDLMQYHQQQEYNACVRAGNCI